MFIEEMKILIDCQRLVENMLDEKEEELSQLHDDPAAYVKALKQIRKFKRALAGEGVEE